MAHEKFYGICENKCLVEINADSVGAAPLEHTHALDDLGVADVNHTHTLEELGASAVDHTHTPAEIGAAATSHTHGAGDITSGTLPIARGGTGGTTATKARTNLEVWKEYSLYNNSSGTTGTITLSDTYTNYKKILVYFNDNGVYNTATLYPGMGTKVGLHTAYLYTSGSGWYLHTTLLSFSGKSVSFSRNGLAQHNTNPAIVVTLSSDAGIRVNKIVGYKY